MEGMKVDGSILILFSANFSLISIYPKALWDGGCMLCLSPVSTHSYTGVYDTFSPLKLSVDTTALLYFKEITL